MSTCPCNKHPNYKGEKKPHSCSVCSDWYKLLHVKPKLERSPLDIASELMANGASESQVLRALTKTNT